MPSPPTLPAWLFSLLPLTCFLSSSRKTLGCSRGTADTPLTLFLIRETGPTTEAGIGVGSTITEGVAAYLPSAAGLLIEKEVRFFQPLLDNPEKPFVAIIGGAKVSSKIDIIENLLDKVDTLLIGGGMAYTFLRAQGLQRLDHYAIFMENNDRYLEACGAGQRAGLYSTCVNSYLTPEELARAAQLEVALRDDEAVVGVAQHRETFPGDAAERALVKKDAVALRRATADAPAQLVQLREPHAFGILDDHQAGVGYVDAHLDYGRRDEHLYQAVLEGLHAIAERPVFLVYQVKRFVGVELDIERHDQLALPDFFR